MSKILNTGPSVNSLIRSFLVPQSGGGGQEQLRQLPEQRDTSEEWVSPESSGPDFLLL